MICKRLPGGCCRLGKLDPCGGPPYSLLLAPDHLHHHNGQADHDDSDGGNLDGDFDYDVLVFAVQIQTSAL